MTGFHDYLIVGAGLYGLTCARLLTNKGYRCLVIDRSRRLGGACHTYKHNGIDIHAYGIHIFHTSDREVWSFVNRYAEFVPTELKVCATDGKGMYSLPFNMYTFAGILGLKTPEQVYDYLSRQKVGEPKNFEEQAVANVGREIFEKLIKGYTEKQWGKSCRELPASIIKRLPVRYSYDNNYFNDVYQGIPADGYTEMAKSILEGKDGEKSIECILGVDFLKERNAWQGNPPTIIYCGSVDEMMDYELGELSWRSLRFEHTTYEYNGHNGQGCPLLNNTSRDVAYTRSIDHVQINRYKAMDYRGEAVLTYEYPQKWQRGMERYYPDGGNELYGKYVAALKKRYPDIVLGGRIGLYRYMNMDETIKAAMGYCEDIKTKTRIEV